MKLFSTENINNVAIIGHAAAGKTSLVSMLLHNAGMVNRLGQTEQGSAVTDFDEEEIERGISIKSALAYCDVKDKRINLIDTPGYSIFIYDAKAALRVADSAILTVCAVNGVEIQTKKVWSFCKEYATPRAFLINKMDRDHADFNKTLEDIRKSFDRRAIPVQIPIGKEDSFEGVVDLIKMKAYYFSKDKSGKFETKDIPADLADEAKALREQMDEMIAENDEALMDKFFESGKLEEADLLAGLKKSILDRNIFPVLVTAASQNIGGHQVLDFISNLMPTASQSGPFKATKHESDEELEIVSDKNGDFTAYVFKSMADPYAGKITMFRVFSGVIKTDSSLYNITKETAEKLGPLMKMQGKDSSPIDEVCAGEIVAVAKLKETQTGDSLGMTKESNVVFAPTIFPKPAIGFALEPKSRGDEEKISSALARILEEDPILKVERSPQTSELIVSGMGQLHIEIIMAKLKKAFGVEAILHPPQVPYLETIRGKSDVEGKYKKQSGGRGQFAVVKVKFEPTERGHEFEFVNDIFGGSVPRNYIPAVEKGMQEARKKGFLTGNPMVDFKAILYDGKFHPVDSSDLAFQIAASMAFKAGIEKASPVLLEPIMNVEIVAPSQFMGDIMGNLSSKRGRPQGSDQSGDLVTIRASVPMSEMLSYQNDLNSITGGQGTFTMEMANYEEVPAQIAQKLVAEHKTDDEEEKE